MQRVAVGTPGHESLSVHHAVSRHGHAGKQCPPCSESPWAVALVANVLQGVCCDLTTETPQSKFEAVLSEKRTQKHWLSVQLELSYQMLPMVGGMDFPLNQDRNKERRAEMAGVSWEGLVVASVVFLTSVPLHDGHSLSHRRGIDGCWEPLSGGGEFQN